MKYENNRKDDSYLDTLSPIQVVVNGRFEDAVKKFRALITKERVMSEIKEHSRYEKPSDKKRRKQREAERNRRKQSFLEKEEQD